MRTSRNLAIAAVAATFAAGPGSTGVQTGQSALATATAVKCTFSLRASSTLQHEPPSAEVKPANLVLEFQAVNADEGTAQLKGHFGQFDIVVRYSTGYLHLIQSFRGGPLHATTVLDKMTASGKLKAMHSRHEYTDATLPGFASSPEQYYGECEVLKGA